MHVRRSSSGVRVLAPAKLNLFLEVLGKRDDGYHEIETLMAPVALFDCLTLQAADDPAIRLDVTVPAHACRADGGTSEAWRVPVDGDNLVVRALNLLRDRSGESRGATVELVKRIPAAAGLAGGSSDAAAALAAANIAWGLNWTSERLARLGAELGSDIPFFFQRGPALATGRGEQLSAARWSSAMHYVIVQPPIGLSTAAVYGACRAAARPRSPAGLIAALVQGRWSGLADGLFNRLQEAASSLSPWIGRLRAEFARLGFLAHAMSGSGASYFGICQHARTARRLAEQLAARGVGRAFAVAGTN